MRIIAGGFFLARKSGDMQFVQATARIQRETSQLHRELKRFIPIELVANMKQHMLVLLL